MGATNTYAAFIARDLPSTVILSCMAVSPKVLEREWPAPRPGLIEWSPTLSTTAHPSWGNDAQRFRDYGTGRLLTPILKRFGESRPERIALFGFSAGSNSGVRELLRNRTDREEISFTACIDGLHAHLKPKTLWTDDPVSPFLDWESQLRPTAEQALRAARGECRMIITGNDLQEPIEGVGRTPFAMRKIYEWVMTHDGVLPFNQALSRQFADAGSPTPTFAFGAGELYCFGYLGTQKRDHIEQAQTVIPRAIRMFLMPLWTGHGPMA